MKFIACTQGSPEWHIARAGVITASCFAIAVSVVSLLTDQQRLYVEAIQAGHAAAEAIVAAGYKAAPRSSAIIKALEGAPTIVPSEASNAYCDEVAIEGISEQPYGDTFQTYAMKRGSEEEFWARARYCELYDVDVIEAGLALTDDGIFGYSTDGFVGTKGMVEIKTPLSTAKIRHIITTDDTAEYEHQIQGGLWLTGREWCDLIVYVPPLMRIGNDIYVKRIYRDEAFIEQLERDLWAFHLRVVEAAAFWRTPFRRDGLADVTDVVSRDVPGSAPAPAPAPASPHITVARQPAPAPAPRPVPAPPPAITHIPTSKLGSALFA